MIKVQTSEGQARELREIAKTIEDTSEGEYDSFSGSDRADAVSFSQISLSVETPSSPSSLVSSLYSIPRPLQLPEHWMYQAYRPRSFDYRTRRSIVTLIEKSPSVGVGSIPILLCSSPSHNYSNPMRVKTYSSR